MHKKALYISFGSQSFYFHCRGVAHKQQLRQYDVEKAEENLTNRKTQRDDMIAQKVISMLQIIFDHNKKSLILEMLII